MEKLKFKTFIKLHFEINFLKLLYFMYLLFFFTYIEISKTPPAKYDQQRLQKKLVKEINVFLRKKKKHQYGQKQYKNLPEDEERELVEYIKSFIK